MPIRINNTSTSSWKLGHFQLVAPQVDRFHERHLEDGRGLGFLNLRGADCPIRGVELYTKWTGNARFWKASLKFKRVGWWIV